MYVQDDDHPTRSTASSSSGDTVDTPGVRQEPETVPVQPSTPLPEELPPTQTVPPTSDRPTSGPLLSESHPSRLPWGRYRILECIGSGGMGTVYRAYDTALARYVALKFLRSDSPEQIYRFLQEARAQARLDHPHICKVYEVGEIGGRPYIAMQLIPGQKLAQAAAHMTLEQKLHVIRQIAEALHAAHRQGLVHRDVKPSNILVERTEEGEWRAYILDFGLARMTEAPGVTTSGTIIGTPQYMAPEQVRGTFTALDRRTDVYALGATLYEILTGRPPFSGESTAEILLQILEKDPIPPRKIQPSIPHDVETIVLKCLEKEPHRRYESARALAEDLRRYLEGEPILARRASPIYRWYKRLRKYPWASGIITALLGMIGILVVMVVHVRWQARERARLAQQFSDQIYRTEAFIRQAYMLPPHDVRYVHRRVEHMMATIRDQIRRLGPIARGPGHYALGRGYLAIGEYARAREYLERAWFTDGYRTPESAFALGWALMELYRRDLEQARWIREAELRRREIQRIMTQYTRSAIAFLARGPEPRGPDVDLVRAFHAFLQQEPERAIRFADRARRFLPWRYETEILIGDAYRMLADRARDRGNIPHAWNAYAHAFHAYLRARNKARSDPRTYTALCGLAIEMLDLSLLQGVFPSLPIATMGNMYCTRARQIHPGRADAHRMHAFLLARWGEYHWQNGQDPRPWLYPAVAAARRAIACNPEDHRNYNALGLALRIFAEYEREQGRIPQPWFQRAETAFQMALHIQPSDFQTRNDLGKLYIAMAEYHLLHGQDAEPELRRAARILNDAVRLEPRMAWAYNNLGTVYKYWAQAAMQRDRDPTVYWQRAVRAYRKAVRIQPTHASAYNNLGTVYLDMAEFALSRKQNPLPALDRARAALENAIRVKPDYAPAYHNLGIVYLTRAEFEHAHARSPLRSLREARRVYRQLLHVTPNDPKVYNNLGIVYQYTADYQARTGADPERNYAYAAQYYRQAIQHGPGNYIYYYNLAEVLTHWATYRTRKGLDAEPQWREAETAIVTAMARNPRDPDVRQLYRQIMRRGRAVRTRYST